MSGLNPDIEHIVGLETTSYSVESAGSDSTMFLWYYSFDFPELSKSEEVSIGIDKEGFLTELDTTINDYTIREFDQFYKTNRIYEPVLIWVRGDEEIRKELVSWVRNEIGPIASPDLIQFAPNLPKTRSGKIMRRILRKIAENDYAELGDTSTLAEPSVVDELIENRQNK